MFKKVRKNKMSNDLQENKELNILQKSIDRLIEMLQNGNIHESIYILGTKKQIIKRNLLAGISRGIGSRNRVYNYNSNYCIFFAKDCKAKYTYNWSIYK